MVEVHKFCIFEKKNVCGRLGANSDTDINNVTCLDCLKYEKKEWQKQVDTFSGQPKKNAILAVKRINKIIKCVIGGKDEESN